MQDKKKRFNDFLPENYSVFDKGLAVQREHFKAANLSKDFDIMVSSIENLLSELEDQIRSYKNGDEVLRIKKILKWYKTIPIKYTVLTENGYVLRIPPQIDIKISHNLNVAYRILIKQMRILRVL